MATRYSIYAATLLVGFILGLVFAGPIEDISKLESGEMIDLYSLIANIIFGVAVVILIQKKQSDDRGVKDFFIAEVNDVKNEYKKLMNHLHKGDISARTTIDCFKLLNTRTSQIESSLKKDLNVPQTDIKETHRAMHKRVTGSNEFNENYNKDRYVLTPQTKNLVMEDYRLLQENFIKLIILVNRA